MCSCNCSELKNVTLIGFETTSPLVGGLQSGEIELTSINPNTETNKTNSSSANNDAGDSPEYVQSRFRGVDRLKLIYSIISCRTYGGCSLDIAKLIKHGKMMVMW